MKEKILIFLFMIISLCNLPHAFAASHPTSPVFERQALSTKENIPLDVNLVKSGALNNSHLNLQFNITGPWHGKLIGLPPNLMNLYRVTYKPNQNYTGFDNFTFFAYDGTHNRLDYRGGVNVSITTPYSEVIQFSHLPPYLESVVTFGFSAGIVVAILFIVWAIIRYRQKEGEVERKFQDIIRDENWYPSLAIFQFLLWTSIVIFAYEGVYLFRLFGGYTNILSIPVNLLLVMGISAGATIASNRLSQDKYGATTPVTEPATKEIPPTNQNRKRLPSFKTMFMENDKVTLARFQMFAWTWIGIGTYLAILFSETLANAGNVQYLSIPDLNIQFVILMGLSQGTYVVNKAIKVVVFSVNEVRPYDVEFKESTIIDIIGSNFGQELGTVWIEYYRPLDDDEKQNIKNKEKEIFKRTIKYRLKKKITLEQYLDEEKFKEARYKRDRLLKQIKAEIKSLDSWKDDVITLKLDDKTMADLKDLVELSEENLYQYLEIGDKDSFQKSDKIKPNEEQYKEIGIKLLEVETIRTLINKNLRETDDDTRLKRGYEIARELKDKLDNAEFVVRVEKQGLLTYPNSDATFRLYKKTPQRV
jgi:hypothetical protein